MISLISPQELDRTRRQVRRYTAALYILCGLGLAVFTALCLLTRTGNAAAMLRAGCASLVLSGWICIVFFLCALQPARRKQTHLEGLLNREPDRLEGRFFLTGDAFQIPKSVRVRKVRLETGKESLLLNLDEEKLSLAPPDGTEVRLETVRKFITGIALPAGTEAREKRPPEKASPLRRAARLFSLLFLPFIVWAMLALMLGGFVFDRITDAPPERKIVIFADMELRDAPVLAEKLEGLLPPPVRMVKIHPFSYAMLNSSAIRGADLYIVPASRAGDYRDWYAPLPAELAGSASPEMPGGLPVFDPASGLRLAGDWLLYETASGTPEPCYLFFSAASVHLADGLALETVRALSGL